MTRRPRWSSTGNCLVLFCPFPNTVTSPLVWKKLCASSSAKFDHGSGEAIPAEPPSLVRKNRGARVAEWVWRLDRATGVQWLELRFPKLERWVATMSCSDRGKGSMGAPLLRDLAR